MSRTISVRIESSADAYLATCPGCGTEAPYLGSSGCIEDWNGETYRFKCCGHRAHLNPANGGATTRVDPSKVQIAK